MKTLKFENLVCEKLNSNETEFLCFIDSKKKEKETLNKKIDQFFNSTMGLLTITLVVCMICLLSKVKGIKIDFNRMLIIVLLFQKDIL